MKWQLFNEGQKAARVREVLDDLLNRLSGIEGGTSVEVAANRFVDWADNAVRMLRGVMNSPELISTVWSDHYWRLRDVGGITRPRDFALVAAAAEAQRHALSELLAQIDHYERLVGTRADSETLNVILDTNVLVHGQPFENVPWNEVVHAKSVRLLLPLVIVDELDTLKDRGYGAAGGVLKSLDGRLARGAVFSEINVRDAVTLQVVDERFDHDRRRRTDEEIVVQASYFSAYTSRPIELVTRDRGMRLRGESAGIPVTMLPGKYERSQPVADNGS